MAHNLRLIRNIRMLMYKGINLMFQRKKILIVDDDIDFVEVNRSLLKRSGFDIIVAFNADECMEKVCFEKPDIIVLDVMMDSTTDGFNLARELDNNEETKNIPIIMVTAINSKLMFEWKHKKIDYNWLPVDVIIEKPVEPKNLLSEINKRLQEKLTGK